MVITTSRPARNTSRTSAPDSQSTGSIPTRATATPRSEAASWAAFSSIRNGSSRRRSVWATCPTGSSSSASRSRSSAATSRRAGKQQRAFALILCERRSALKLRARFVVSAQFFEHVGARRVQQVISVQLPLRDEVIHRLETARGAERHPQCHRTVQLDHRGRHDAKELVVQGHDPVSYTHLTLPTSD